jgi:thiol-disulfide isomerase/thioredoxin
MGFIFLAMLALWLTGLAAARLNTDRHLCAHIAERGIGAGLVFSRLGFAFLNPDSYTEKPWTVLYFWQPGYSLVTGAIAALMYIAFQVHAQSHESRKVIVRAIGHGFIVPIVLFSGLLMTMNRFLDEQLYVPGERIPDYPVIDLAGKPVALTDLAGKGLVVNFWATWCSPCRREMPLLENIHNSYRERNIVVIGVSVDASRQTIVKYIGSSGINYPIWQDVHTPGNTEHTTSLADHFGVKGYPTTLFIDAKGVIQSSYVGELNLAILNQRIATLIPVSGSN